MTKNQTTPINDLGEYAKRWGKAATTLRQLLTIQSEIRDINALLDIAGHGADKFTDADATAAELSMMIDDIHEIKTDFIRLIEDQNVATLDEMKRKLREL